MTSDSRLQASVFMNGRGRIADPHDDMPDYCWVTAHLPENMSCDGQSDEEIMNLVLCKIQIGNVIIGDSALHSLGCYCLSLPVKVAPGENTGDVLYYAETLAEWWLKQIRLGRACLDQYSIFEATWRSLEHTNSLEDVPHGWGQCPEPSNAL
ncbi:hypothetical protein PENPOL_c001G10259 [Penicillium polonicum]|uniref:Uncharacterized protein n=1 Tax=Penicillium polonicum TaxID=60169 RepID=A0A1V6P1V5_PENPO|nr:hypothetical protein PENPOL_c001G10259 [Penicillium polonicum]